MDRTMPVAHSEEIELYIRTYYSLLRSSGPIRVRSLEDTHAAMNSSLHHGADHSELDITALTYSALRLPEEITQTSFVIMGQMEDVFAREGYPVRQWQRVRARARRRKFYFDAEDGHLAALHRQRQRHRRPDSHFNSLSNRVEQAAPQAAAEQPARPPAPLRGQRWLCGRWSCWKWCARR